MLHKGLKIMQKSLGFTLIELMVTLAIAAIIMSMAVPAAKTMQANTRVSSVASDLATDLKKVRSEAIVTRRDFSFVPNSSVWNSQGWKATTTINSQINIFLKKESIPDTVTIIEASANYNINFLGTSGMTNTVTDVVFKVCDSSTTSEKGYNVLLNRFGRVLIQRHSSTNICNP